MSESWSEKEAREEREMRDRVQKGRGSFAAGISFAAVIVFLFYQSWLTGIFLALSIWFYIHEFEQGN